MPQDRCIVHDVGIGTDTEWVHCRDLDVLLHLVNGLLLYIQVLVYNILMLGILIPRYVRQ